MKLCVTHTRLHPCITRVGTYITGPGTVEQYVFSMDDGPKAERCYKELSVKDNDCSYTTIHIIHDKLFFDIKEKGQIMNEEDGALTLDMINETMRELSIDRPEEPISMIVPDWLLDDLKNCESATKALDAINAKVDGCVITFPSKGDFDALCKHINHIGL